jgi:hypothetical protein
LQLASKDAVDGPAAPVHLAEQAELDL